MASHGRPLSGSALLATMVLNYEPRTPFPNTSKSDKSSIYKCGLDSLRFTQKKVKCPFFHILVVTRVGISMLPCVMKSFRIRAFYPARVTFLTGSEEKRMPRPASKWGLPSHQTQTALQFCARISLISSNVLKHASSAVCKHIKILTSDQFTNFCTFEIQQMLTGCFVLSYYVISLWLSYYSFIHLFSKCLLSWWRSQVLFWAPWFWALG